MRCENFALYHNQRLLRADPCSRSVIKEFARAFSVRISSYGCTWEVWRALKKLYSRLRLELFLRIFSALKTSRVHP